MADGFTRIRRGRQNGVFAAQAGPGIENAFPGIAQAFSENVKKKDKKSGMAIKLSFVAPIGPFFNRLGIFFNARLLKITLVLLVFCESCIGLIQKRFTERDRQQPCGHVRFPPPLACGSLFAIRNEPIWTETETALCEVLAKRGSKRR